jgi:hypothetical protein
MTDKERLKHIKNIMTVQLGRIAEHLVKNRHKFDSGTINLFNKIADDAETMIEVVDFEE